MEKEDFKKAVEIILSEFNKYFSLSNVVGWDDGAIYKGSQVGEMIKKQIEEDYDSILIFLKNRLDDDVINEMIEDKILKVTNYVGD